MWLAVVIRTRCRMRSFHWYRYLSRHLGLSRQHLLLIVISTEAYPCSLHHGPKRRQHCRGVALSGNVFGRLGGIHSIPTTWKDARPGCTTCWNIVRRFARDVSTFLQTSLVHPSLSHQLLVTMSAENLDKKEAAGPGDSVQPIHTDSDSEAGKLEDILGYKAELHRNRALSTLLFQSLAIAAIPFGEGAPLLTAIYGGGQLSIFVGWFVGNALNECTALSLSELASRYPTSGGPSYWAFQVAPKSKTLAAYLTGWIYLIGNWTITLRLVEYPFMGSHVVLIPSAVSTLDSPA
jgi:hypothetical protein